MQWPLDQPALGIACITCIFVYFLKCQVLIIYAFWWHVCCSWGCQSAGVNWCSMLGKGLHREGGGTLNIKTRVMAGMWPVESIDQRFPTVNTPTVTAWQWSSTKATLEPLRKRPTSTSKKGIFIQYLFVRLCFNSYIYPTWLFSYQSAGIEMWKSWYHVMHFLFRCRSTLHSFSDLWFNFFCSSISVNNVQKKWGKSTWTDSIGY